MAPVHADDRLELDARRRLAARHELRLVAGHLKLWARRRDEVIRWAIRLGVPQTEIARDLGVSRQWLFNRGYRKHTTDREVKH